MRSHSQAPGSVSSKSLIPNTRFRSAEANTPKLATCMSPQAWTVRPVTGVRARSAAITAAEPRRNANGLASIRAYRIGNERRESRLRLLLENRHRVLPLRRRPVDPVFGVRVFRAKRLSRCEALFDRWRRRGEARQASRADGLRVTRALDSDSLIVHSCLARCLRHSYCAGMVINGSFSLPPVSASVKKNMTAVSARFVCQSPSSIQNQWSR